MLPFTMTTVQMPLYVTQLNIITPSFVLTGGLMQRGSQYHQLFSKHTLFGQL